MKSAKKTSGFLFSRHQCCCTGRVLANFVAMPIQGVVEDTFSIGAPEDMKKYFSFYEKQILDVTNLEQTNSPWCVAHATLRDATHCKTPGSS